MKYVVGVIPSRCLDDVRRALGDGGIYRLTVGEVEVFQCGTGAPPASDERQLRLEIAVNDEFLEPAVAAFGSALAAGEGEVWISVQPLERVQRIRTDEEGSAAI